MLVVDIVKIHGMEYKICWWSLERIAKNTFQQESKHISSPPPFCPKLITIHQVSWPETPPQRFLNLQLKWSRYRSQLFDLRDRSPNRLDNRPLEHSSTRANLSHCAIQSSSSAAANKTKEAQEVTCTTNNNWFSSFDTSCMDLSTIYTTEQAAWFL